MPDYAQEVHDYIHALGDLGDEVQTAIWPHLANKFDLSPEEATHARRQAMQELTRRGLVERLNSRSRCRLSTTAENCPRAAVDSGGQRRIGRSC